MSFTRAKRVCSSLLLRTFLKSFSVMEDDCVCEYDSTWDTESDGDDPAAESLPRRPVCYCTRRTHSVTEIMSIMFWISRTDVYIDSFLKDWKNDYKRLERVHSYIQWYPFIACIAITYLFNEQFLREDAKKRLVESYELMLGFYGIRLVDKDTGEVKRAENWKERFGNLERNMHNNLRITRILKSLGELGFEHYQAPLVHFFLEETLVRKTLSSVKRSVLDYFLFAVLDKQKRQELVRYAYLHFEPKDKFVWCPRKIQRQFRKLHNLAVS
uniref:Opioid growth factor receptor (OGFr) conserved domain-containing protein n=1 Tax=Periophthalmus magnuspinnatus TaxID=409849 RepID=A0A3B3ZJV4_9GOBI